MPFQQVSEYPENGETRSDVGVFDLQGQGLLVWGFVET